ncbi:uncharacterized protein F4807DRAFT_415118 [Annulohypoxylon truncatum]|uniref:uncharacterized protein n=1 Tax=Annulohypoxylon truncatum TaxID=327061 RepID=UPI002007F0BE|nr:uncharacterized protein F4807DRAFT_415118 [Annulohypoxylon truncatum]KAI1212211.1 hypothetical protein F4807DRAFT_415118 [Annulohypoxylon truncatum]
MAKTTTRSQGVPLPSIIEPPSLVASDGEPSPTSDGAADEEQLYIDQDDAQSIIQPALSPVATRLTLPKTPAAEKAAAMERVTGGGLFSVIEGTATPDPEPSPMMGQSSETLHQVAMNKASTRQARGLSLGQLPSSHSSVYRFPSPWQSGPKQMVVQNESGSPKPVLSTVFRQDKHRRSSSGGADALKRIKEALPSMPSMPSISLQSFFSGPSSAKSPSLDAKRSSLSNDSASEPKQFPPFLVDEPGPISRSKLPPPPNRQSLVALSIPNAESSSLSRPPIRPRAIRRSTSDESMLYHSLSRVSSLGDDDRWKDIREQTNSRLKAITDSWDRPTFKLPQLPNIIPAPLKKNPLLGPDQSDQSLSGGARTSTIFEVSSPTPRDDNLSDLDRALELLTGDIVIMGGYRGSVLRSTRTNRQVWVPVKLGLNIRKVNLEVGPNPEDEERMEETIYASGMLKNIGPVDISKRLFKRLRECENARTGKLRIWDYGYDWRLSPHLLSRRLIKFLEHLPSNQGQDPLDNKGAMVIAHSLGGLITRHAVNQRPELFSGVIYAGTPQRCINILGPIRNGDAVLFNEKVLTAQVNFSLRTTFVFLPEDGFCFINKNTGEQYPVDFYDPQEWVKYCWSPCIEPCLPSFKSRSSALASLRELSERLPAPLRSRGNSAASESRSPTRNIVTEATRKADIATDRTLAPQMGSSQGDAQQQTDTDAGSRSANFAYLTRVLADTKRFREETKHRPEHTLANRYPPLAVIYGKEVPTVWAVSVTSREQIACADAYDDLMFRSGDGVVLAREAMLPEGYELVKEGRVSTDRGHITMLGDLEAVGRALLAVVRGRRKGIGLGGEGAEA